MDATETISMLNENLKSCFEEASLHVKRKFDSIFAECSVNITATHTPENLTNEYDVNPASIIISIDTIGLSDQVDDVDIYEETIDEVREQIESYVTENEIENNALSEYLEDPSCFVLFNGQQFL